jgi:hypothetical protein
MIKHVDLATEPIAAGEVRELRVEAADPIQVSIKCFVYDPPPERFTTCPECGTFQIKSDEALLFQASTNKFHRGGGVVVVSIRDDEGDTEEFKLEVVEWGHPSAGDKPMRPRIKTPDGTIKDAPELEEVSEPALAR